MHKITQLAHMPRASNHLLFTWEAGVEKVREQAGRGSAPFPALAGAGRRRAGSLREERGAGAGSAAPPAAGALWGHWVTAPLPLPASAWPRVPPGRGAGGTAGGYPAGRRPGSCGKPPGSARVLPPSQLLSCVAHLPPSPGAGGERRHRGAPAAEAAAAGGPGRAAAGGAAAAASHKGQIHFPRPERGGGKARCRVGPTASGRLRGEDLARERKASCLLDSVELYHVRKTSYYQDHLKLLESHSVFLFIIFGGFGFF